MPCMEIAIIAADMKKELMTQFCIAYCGVLSKHNLCATSITAKYISEATGLTIEKMLTGEQGGEQQIATRVAYNEIDILLYFRDTRPEAIYDDKEGQELLLACDRYNIPGDRSTRSRDRAAIRTNDIRADGPGKRSGLAVVQHGNNDLVCLVVLRKQNAVKVLNLDSFVKFAEQVCFDNCHYSAPSFLRTAVILCPSSLKEVILVKPSNTKSAL